MAAAEQMTIIDREDDDTTQSANRTPNSNDGKPTWLEPFHFKPGQSGNPNGRPKVPNEVLKLARANSPRAMQRLIELIESNDERVAMMAAKEVIDRAYGKTAQAKDEEADDGKSVTINIVRYADGHNQIERQTTNGVRTVKLSS